MPLGRIVIDNMLTLDITGMALRGGQVAFTANGSVANGIPAGVVPLALYGADDSLIAVGRHNFDRLIARVSPLRKGDVLDLTYTWDILTTQEIPPCARAHAREAGDL